MLIFISTFRTDINDKCFTIYPPSSIGAVHYSIRDISYLVPDQILNVRQRVTLGSVHVSMWSCIGYSSPLDKIAPRADACKACPMDGFKDVWSPRKQLNDTFMLSFDTLKFIKGIGFVVLTFKPLNVNPKMYTPPHKKEKRKKKEWLKTECSWLLFACFRPLHYTCISMSCIW